MDSSRERSRSPVDLVLWHWCWKISDSGSWYWEWFPVTYSWLRQKASISSSENLSSTPATTNQDAFQHAVKLRHVGSANVAVLPEGGRTAN